MEQSLQEFFLTGKSITYKKGQTILAPNETLRGFYFLEQGHIKIYTLTQNGEEKIHCFLSTEDIFPLHLLCKTDLVKNYYEAMTEVQVRMITKEDLFNYIENNRTGIYTFMGKFCDTLTMYENRISELEYTTPYQRLIVRLLFMAKKFGTKDKGTIVIHLPITHKDIANSINTTRETVNKEFRALTKKGIIEYSRSQIIIRDMKRLSGEVTTNHLP